MRDPDVPPAADSTYRNAARRFVSVAAGGKATIVASLTRGAGGSRIDEAAPEIRDRLGPRLGRVAAGELQRPGARSVSEGLVDCDAGQRAPQRLHVLDRHPEAVHALLDQVVAGARRLARDEREPRRRGLRHRHPPRLRPRRHHERVRGRVPVDQLLALDAAEQAHPRAGEGGYMLAVGAVADEHELAWYSVEGADEHVDSLLP